MFKWLSRVISHFKRKISLARLRGAHVHNAISCTGDIKAIDRTGYGASVRNVVTPGNIVAISTTDEVEDG